MIISNYITKIFTPQRIILLFVLLIFFLSLRWNHFTAPFERDEGVYAYSAWIMRKGIMPYEYSFPYKPPLIIYVYMISQNIFGEVIWGPRVLLALASLVIIFLVGLIMKKAVNERSAWISMFLLAPMLILPVNFGGGEIADVYYAAVSEIFMLVPILAFLFIYVQYGTKANNKLWFFSGVLSAIAVGFKPICPFILGFIYIYWLLDSWKVNRNIKSIILKLGFAIFGFVVMGILELLPFLLHDGGRAMWNQIFGFSTCFVDMSSNNFGIEQLFNRLLIMGKYYWLAYILLIYFVIKKPKHWFFFLGLLLISFLSVYYSLIGHYFLQVIPFLAITTAYSISKILEIKYFARVNSALIILVIITFFIFPIRAMFGKTPEDLSLWVYGNYDPFYEAEIVGEKMKLMTNPNDFVYVEGPDPEIVYFSQRRNAVRMEWTDFMRSTCPALKPFQTQYLKDLNENKPEVITLCIYGSCGYLWEDEDAKYFTDYLLKKIEDEYELVGGWIPNGNKGYWLEPIEEEVLPQARTVIYRRKQNQ